MADIDDLFDDEDDDINLEQWCEENHYPEELITAAQDLGYKTNDDIIDWIESGDYTIIHARGGSKYDLGVAYADEIGYPSEKSRYFDIDGFRKDVEIEYYSDQEEDEDDDEYESRIESEIDSYVDEMVSLIENGECEDILDRHFDYEGFGHDLAFDFSYYENGLWIATY